MAGIARARGEARPTAYAATFPDHPELDEAPYRDALSRHVGLDLVEVPVKAGPLLPAGQAYVERWATPAPNGSAFLFGPVTRAAVGRGHRFLLDGEGGDELFAPEPYLLADLLLRGNLIGLVQCALRLRDAPRLPRRRVMQQALRRWAVPGALPWWLHSRIRRARRHEIEDIAWKRRPGPRWWAHLVDDLTTGHPPENLDVLRRLAALDGAINLNPLLDDELVSCVLSIDPASVFDPEIDRGLVRRAHRGLLPELILQRGSKVEFGRVYLASIVEHDLKDATRDLRDPDAPIRQFANAATIDAILAPRSAKMDSDWARRLWRITALNTWLVTLWSS
jgi:asparagine synthetase B (glutamine-hydrolysing)